jgi:hypothetical protein
MSLQLSPWTVVIVYRYRPIASTLLGDFRVRQPSTPLHDLPFTPTKRRLNVVLSLHGRSVVASALLVGDFGSGKILLRLSQDWS